MFRFALALPLLVGCGGSVAVDEADPFGIAMSALWVEYSDSDFEVILVSNIIGLCGLLQTEAEAAQDLEDELEDIDADDYCEEAREPVQEYTRRTQALSVVGGRFLGLVTVTEDGDQVIDEDSFEVGDLPALGGYLSYTLEDNSNSILVDWDEDDDLEDNCGVDEIDAEDYADVWVLDDGSQLDIENLTDTSFSATLEGELLDSDGDGAGEITGSFAPLYCEVDA